MREGVGETANFLRVLSSDCILFRENANDLVVGDRPLHVTSPSDVWGLGGEAAAGAPGSGVFCVFVETHLKQLSRRASMSI